MKSIHTIFIFVTLLTSGRMMAQSKDSVPPARKVAESGGKGDIILGKQNKKDQLNAEPQMLQKDSLRKEASAQSRRKKIKVVRAASKMKTAHVNFLFATKTLRREERMCD